ncbi:MAG: phosphopantothenoylcysteine decarboxylase [Candidatus Omnitrophota bacterium]
MSLRNKRILITAGPTWIAIDKVRVISNTATGATGKLLANQFANKGAKVTLLINAENKCCLNKKIRVLPFQFFGQLNEYIQDELSRRTYDICVHSAAVSDYKPVKISTGKISSDRKLLRLGLKPTPKIINRIKKIDSSLFLVGFKYEPDKNKDTLIREAKKLMDNSKADIIVANTSGKNGYRAYIIRKNGVFHGPLRNKPEMIKNLLKAINSFFTIKKTLQ